MRAAVCAFLVGVVAMGCSGKSTDPNKNTYSYAGAGSSWSWELKAGGTFTASESTVGLEIQGNYTRLPTGFVKLEVTAATGPNAPPAGAQALGLEVPGVVFLVKPTTGGESHVLTLVAAGECPTSNFDANWIHTQFEEGADMTDVARDSFGTFHWEQAGSSASVLSKYALQGYTPLDNTQPAMSGSCSEGVMTINNNGEGVVTLYLTALGGAVVHIPNGQAVLAMPRASISSASALAGSYAGLLFNAGNVGDDRIRPMSAEINDTGTQITAQGLTDVETGATDPDIQGTVAITGTNLPSNGFFEATVTSNGGTGNLACMAATDVVGSGRNIFFCVGQSPGDNHDPFNVLFVSKDE